MILEDFLDEISTHFQLGLPFVAYRKPNESSIKALLQNDANLNLVNDYSESGFLFAPFNDNEKSILIPLENSKVIAIDIDIQEKPTNQPVALNSVSEEKDAHINLVQKGIDAINSNQFQKVVLSRQELVKTNETNPLILFKRLLINYPTAFVYCFYHPKVGLWLGATPETLLEVKNTSFTTIALAGTQQYNGTLDVDWNDKEKEEQQFVTDFIVNSLEPSVKRINVFNVETIKAGNLLHLRTRISGIFNDSNLKNVLNKLHPTPAVCGTPRNVSKQFIFNNENYKREFYTGFLGELNFKEKQSRNTNRRNVENNAYANIKTVSNLFVNLRCMQLKDNKVIIYVGGGITKDSNPESEWTETVSKTQIMKKVLQ